MSEVESPIRAMMKNHAATGHQTGHNQACHQGSHRFDGGEPGRNGPSSRHRLSYHCWHMWPEVAHSLDMGATAQDRLEIPWPPSHWPIITKKSM